VAKLHLILAFHNHQPVGNFDDVLEDCFRKCYQPFLETLLAHPGIKVVLHYSGYLLLWMKEKHPEALDMIRTLLRTGKAEILSGGFYEPILSVLPEKDRGLQLDAYSEFIAKEFGCRPKGIWLAERVWEPQMPRFISRAGMRYLPVDDYHFSLTGLEEDDLFGYYMTEDEGHVVRVFPGSEKLRYFIPFRTVEDVISYFREVAARGGTPLLTMADDGEKFGVWPKTYKHCYEDGWLEAFFTALEENSAWLTTTTFDEYCSAVDPLGRVYLPSASYREMGEWALPAQAALEYERVAKEMSDQVGERSKRLLRGSTWRSFMVKYPEANHLHKRMLMISGKVHKAAKLNAEEGKQAMHELWKGQCNDAYWHGIFGGLYLPHLRSALHRHLLGAEQAAGRILKAFPFVECGDFDCDGYKDIVAGNSSIALAATEKGGGLAELSLYRSGVNILDILARRPEAYHSKITAISGSVSDATQTIHDQLTVREAGLSNYLVYDRHRRTSLLDHFLPPDTAVEDLMMSRHKEMGNFIEGTYSMEHSVTGGNISLSFEREGKAGQNAVKIRKTLKLTRSRELRVGYVLEGAFRGLFAVEMNISLFGSPLASIRIGEETVPVRSTGMRGDVKGFRVEESYSNVAVDWLFNESIDLWYYPVETISLSEQGIERLYQGTCFLFVVNLDLRDGKQIAFKMRLAEGKR
jgi:hypothetical protein